MFVDEVKPEESITINNLKVRCPAFSRLILSVSHMVKCYSRLTYTRERLAGLNESYATYDRQKLTLLLLLLLILLQ